jgi:hypothetical protein
MAQQTINNGTTAGDGTGETLFDAFGKVNSNFTEVYAGVVTNGNSHNHDGGDGAQIAYTSLSGLPTLGTAAAAATTDFAVAAKGVTNGDTHDHSGGDGAQIAYSGLSGLPVAGTDFLAPAAIGSTVQAYDADTAKLDVAQSWTAQQTFVEIKDTVHTISDGAAFEIDPANGSVQVVTLGASRTPAATNFEAGQTVLLGIDDGTAYTVTWTTVAVTWVKPGGTASAPTLATTGYTWVLLWKVGSVVYGAEVGKP